MKKEVSGIIKDWVEKNKTLFWKYEISTFHRTFKINVRNLPNPESGDISISPHVQPLNGPKKALLCSAIVKACTKEKETAVTCVDVEVGFADGEVVASVVSAGRKEKI